MTEVDISTVKLKLYEIAREYYTSNDDKVKRGRLIGARKIAVYILEPEEPNDIIEAAREGRECPT